MRVNGAGESSVVCAVGRMGAAMTIIGKKDPTSRLVSDMTARMFDRDELLDSLESAQQLLGHALNGRRYHESFFNAKGVQVMVKVMEKWNKRCALSRREPEAESRHRA